MFQHQLNVVRSVWRRLESWKGSQNVPTILLSNAPSDKLRVLGETLLDILLYTVYEIGPVLSVCFLFFTHFPFKLNRGFFFLVSVGRFLQQFLKCIFHYF